MPSLLNNPSCPGYGLNTALPDCPLEPKHIVGAILVPKSKSFSASDLAAATFLTTLVAQCQLDSKLLRSYPIFRFENMADESEATVKQTLGFGGSVVVRDGKYLLTFQVLKGGLLRHINLRSLNKTNRKVLFVDNDGKIYGVKGGTTAAPTLQGFTLDFFQAQPWKPGDGANAAKYELQFALAKPKEMNESLGVWMNEAGTDVEETVKGVMDVELENYGTITATTFKFKARTKLEAINLYDSYSAAFVTAGSGAVNVVNKATGAAITVSSIALDAANSGWTVTISSSPGVTVQFSLKGPTTLGALGTPIGGGTGYGFESDTIEIVIP